ncbi:MAG: exodeoxyribonuclease VII small subunit [Deltaproteobacteria bacterium]|nr:MAG: exodeoxyribonuclease VII small subunit [Deltaproteobacteria bacterium]
MSKKTFEESLKQLEQIVEDLESGDLSLEKALAKFEEGVKLSKSCTSKLDEIERKITILLKDQTGEIDEKPFVSDTMDES